jgi:hypothetical protein
MPGPRSYTGSSSVCAATNDAAQQQMSTTRHHLTISRRRRHCLRGYKVCARLQMAGEIRLPALGIFDVSAQNLGDAPGLCKTSARPMWGIAIEYFRDLA